MKGRNISPEKSDNRINKERARKQNTKNLPLKPARELNLNIRT